MLLMAAKAIRYLQIPVHIQIQKSSMRNCYLQFYLTVSVRIMPNLNEEYTETQQDPKKYFTFKFNTKLHVRQTQMTLLCEIVSISAHAG